LFLEEQKLEWINTSSLGGQIIITILLLL
jgi:hypothetical protein